MLGPTQWIGSPPSGLKSLFLGPMGLDEMLEGRAGNKATPIPKRSSDSDFFPDVFTGAVGTDLHYGHEGRPVASFKR